MKTTIEILSDKTPRRIIIKTDEKDFDVMYSGDFKIIESSKSKARIEIYSLGSESINLLIDSISSIEEPRK